MTQEKLEIGNGVLGHDFFFKSVSAVQIVVITGQSAQRRHTYRMFRSRFFIGKSEAKAEDPVDWSFAVLELLREQGWDVKEMNDR